jgi:hypothetical protein
MGREREEGKVEDGKVRKERGEEEGKRNGKEGKHAYLLLELLPGFEDDEHLWQL